MINVPLKTLLSKSNWILSIVPPGEAFAFAQKLRTVLAGLALPRAFVDCNAVNPETVRRIGVLFRETPVGFIDAGIDGTPPFTHVPNQDQNKCWKSLLRRPITDSKYHC
ncbi:hypothetical protein BD769DRAFT_1416757 [Suillus cothurnatus]|nr:hypothetical protein BD769DRAFT_1416757 [Suillus cothurnatus]